MLTFSRARLALNWLFCYFIVLQKTHLLNCSEHKSAKVKVKVKVPLQVKIFSNDRYKTRIPEEVKAAGCGTSVTSTQDCDQASRLTLAACPGGQVQATLIPNNVDWFLRHFPQSRCQFESLLKQSIIKTLSAVMWPAAVAWDDFILLVLHWTLHYF